MSFETQGSMRAVVVTGVPMDPNQLKGNIELFDADGNPVDIPALTAFMNKFDFTGAQDGYLLVYDGTREKYVPLPLSGTGD
jgi:hypothetical protein